MPDLSHQIGVRTLGFNLPCRQFVIGAQVTRDRRLPLVDEFVLRVIRLCEQMSVRRLKAFFGFSDLETHTVLADLHSRSLVLLDRDKVSLHPSAVEMFRTSPSGVPQIVETENWINRLWFDLITRSMITSPNLRFVRNLIELRRPAGEEDMESSFARAAFQSNFRDYLRFVRRINNPDHLGLYAVTSVDAGRFSFAQLTGRQTLTLDPHPRLDTVLDLPDTERPQRLRQLTDAMALAMRDHVDPEPSLAARADYLRLTGSSVPDETTPFVDLRGWIAREVAANEGQTVAVIGCTYLESTARSFTTLLEHTKAVERIADEDQIDVLWFRPGGSLWGTSDDLRTLVSDIRGALRRISKRNPRITTTLIIPATLSSSQAEQRRRFSGTFDQGLVAPTGLFSPAIDVLLIRGIAATVSMLAPLGPTVNVWIGRMTARETDLDRLERRIGWSESTRWTTAWRQGASALSGAETQDN